jgi:hypothetical protein
MKDEALKLALEALEKNTKHLPADFDYHFEAITAIKKALAQPAPVQQEQGEPDYKTLAIQLQQQRTWVGLTNEERNTIIRHQKYVDNIIRATEAKLKEKNT